MKHLHIYGWDRTGANYINWLRYGYKGRSEIKNGKVVKHHGRPGNKYKWSKNTKEKITKAIEKWIARHNKWKESNNE
jgi:hypothetical protein